MKTFVAWFFGNILLATTSEAAPLPLGLDKSQFERRVPAYLKTLPSCKALTLSDPHPMIEEAGAGWKYFAQGASKSEVLVQASDEQLTRIIVKASSSSEPVLRDMRCMTYALMLAVQPKYSIQHLVLSDSKKLWRLAQGGPYRQLYFFITFEARLTPVQLDVYR
ncbi:hypothetical protein [Pseudomonas asuensis]|nr:hypothetical protein [Pseudomonas asuensis]